MDLTKEIKTREMGNTAVTTVKTNNNLDFTKEIKKVVDKVEFYSEATEATGEIIFHARSKDMSILIDEILKVTKSYSNEEFTLELTDEYDFHASKEIYKAKNGQADFYKTDIDYSKAEESLSTPPDTLPLLDKALRCFKKLDIDENGKLSLSRHKHTVEVEGDEYKLLVSKFGDTYKVEKVFSKVPTYTWEEIKDPLPF